MTATLEARPAAPADHLHQRYLAAARKVRLLGSLRETVGLPPAADVTPAQWRAIEAPLAAAEHRLASLLRRAGERHLGRLHDLAARRALNACLGGLEVALSRALAFFDTFVDILSQRHLPEAGVLLAGCDELASDALDRPHPALSTLARPLVFLDRGFGASTLREGVALGGRTRNPLQTIQIPYTKLREKLTLTSVMHEAGHSAMARLDLNTALPAAVTEALGRAGVRPALQSLFGLWMREIGPDFWVFATCGVAAASGVREILGLAPSRVLAVSRTDPHPPPYLRVLLHFEWCRQQWGRGPWEDWESDWLALYPVDGAAGEDRAALAAGRRALPVVAATLLRERLGVLGDRPLSSLFDWRGLAPEGIAGRARNAARTGIVDLSGLSPCAHLAVFRALKDGGVAGDDALDRLMTTWLQHLGRRGRARPDRRDKEIR
jgi:hypothetical protein